MKKFVCQGLGMDKKQKEEVDLVLATFNVHMWKDAKGRRNVERVAKLIERERPDILCVQESTRAGEQEFWKELTKIAKNEANSRNLLNHCCKNNRLGCNILSNQILENLDNIKINVYARFISASITLKGHLINITCLHLDHAYEPHRLSELEAIVGNLEDMTKPQVLTGDFNALTREDYDEDKWMNVKTVRERNHWESPKTELTSKVKEYGFKDCWELCGRPGPIKTCRFNTRIDYVYVNQAFLDIFKVVDVRAIFDDASDHNLVKAKFVFKDGRKKK